MAIELKVPAVGESISEVQIGPWLKRVGECALKDENLVEIETDKATVEVPAPVSGKLTQLLKQTGQTARVGEVIGYMEESPAGESPAGKSAAGPDGAEPDANDRAAAQAQAAQAIIATAARSKDRAQAARAAAPQSAPVESRPAAVAPSVPAQPRSPLPAAPLVAPFRGAPSEARQEETVPMSPIRRRIAERLVEAQRTAALLTTFNEIDMSAVIGLRNEHKQVFQERYGIKLGFMSFFVKAAIDALKHVPQVNAEIRDTDIIYHNYFDIGIAVGGGKGLVVPVLRDADRMSFAQIEAAITDLAERARNNALSLEELQGGTFTISNGGVYGSLLSTPIVNPPQSGILGLHAIQDRPVARDGQVVIRPMMYVALTYDHRIVDGQGAVRFLKRVKDVVEQPLRMLMET